MLSMFVNLALESSRSLGSRCSSNSMLRGSRELEYLATSMPSPQQIRQERIDDVRQQGLKAGLHFVANPR